MVNLSFWLLVTIVVRQLPASIASGDSQRPIGKYWCLSLFFPYFFPTSNLALLLFPPKAHVNREAVLSPSRLLGLSDSRIFIRSSKQSRRDSHPLQSSSYLNQRSHLLTLLLFISLLLGSIKHILFQKPQSGECTN